MAVVAHSREETVMGFDAHPLPVFRPIAMCRLATIGGEPSAQLTGIELVREVEQGTIPVVHAGDLGSVTATFSWAHHARIKVIRSAHSAIASVDVR